MKTNELMIGDWVSWDSENGRIAGLSHDENDEYGPVQMVDDEDLDIAHVDIEPIPLTEEILKANGFERIDDVLVLRLANNEGYFRIECFKLPNIRIATQTSKGFHDLHYTFDYVHQLQHALRLVGLNNLADNFKVE